MLFRTERNIMFFESSVKFQNFPHALAYLISQQSFHCSSSGITVLSMRKLKLLEVVTCSVPLTIKCQGQKLMHFAGLEL